LGVSWSPMHRTIGLKFHPGIQMKISRHPRNPAIWLVNTYMHNADGGQHGVSTVSGSAVSVGVANCPNR
jgi:hypothetical protein